MFPELAGEGRQRHRRGIFALAGSRPARPSSTGLRPRPALPELARRGYRVTGVDRTAAFLEEAPPARLPRAFKPRVQADMRRFCRPEAFDLAINLLHRVRLLRRTGSKTGRWRGTLSSLRPGGVLVMELMGKVLARIFRERDWREEPDGASCWKSAASARGPIECR